MRYLVMETQRSFAIVMDEMSRCYIAANMGYEVGQVVEGVVLKQAHRPAYRPSSAPRRALGVVAVLAACLLVFFGVNAYIANNSIYGSIYMSINPIIQMDLNKNGRVVNITPLNDDGQALIGKTEYKGMEAAAASRLLTDKAIDNGILTDGGAVLFEIDSKDKAFFQHIGTGIRTEVKGVIEGRVDAELYVTDYADRFEIPPRATPTPEPTPEPAPSPEAEATPSPTPTTPASIAPAPVAESAPAVQQQQEPASPVSAPESTPAPVATQAQQQPAAATARPPQPVATQAPVQTAAPQPQPAAPAPPAPAQNDSGYDSEGDSNYSDDGDSGYDDD